MTAAGRAIGTPELGTVTAAVAVAGWLAERGL
jgi:hypothetical protein